MKVVGIAGYSGSGKTTLVEQLLVLFKAAGLRVSVVKHAHHSFDIDHAGKDSFRHREAGAFEVLVASSKRLALVREYDTEASPTVHQCLAQLDPAVDWVLVEGFKQSDLQKIEVWRPAASARTPLYPHDDFIVAIATDAPGSLPQTTLRPVLDLNHPPAVAAWLIDNGARFDYRSERYRSSDHSIGMA